MLLLSFKAIVLHIGANYDVLPNLQRSVGGMHIFHVPSSPWAVAKEMKEPIGRRSECMGLASSSAFTPVPASPQMRSRVFLLEDCHSTLHVSKTPSKAFDGKFISDFGKQSRTYDV